MQNARVEAIDLLSFWISMAQCLGLDARDVLDLYHQQLKVNHARQDQDYSMASKSEEDDKNVRLCDR